MRTATALTIIAIGAIFAFAITAHPSFLNVQVVGWVLMVTGVCGIVIPRRGRGWLRRSVLVKGSPDFTTAKSAADLTPPPVAEHEIPITDGAVERESIVEYTEK